MDNPNITMEEYGKIWYDEDVLDLRSVETKFPAIVFSDSLTLNETPSCEPTVRSNDEIDFRISFDESDDEDYTVVFDKNSFSYKIISTIDLKTDSENDNEKVNKPLFLSPEPAVSCIDNLEFFKEFENEFPAIGYNDALTSKSDLSTEPTLCPQDIDKFDLKEEASLFKNDEVEKSILYFNDLFHLNIIYPDDQKSNKGNDENEIDRIQSARGNENINKLLKESYDKIRKVFVTGSFIMGLNMNIIAWNHFVNGMLFNLIKNLYVPFGIPFDPKRYYKDGDCARILRMPRAIRHMAPLPPRDQRHLLLHYQVEGYTEEIVHNFEQRIETIFGRQVNRLHILDFKGLTLDMWQDLAERMRMVYTGDDGQEEFLLEFFSTYRIGDEMGLDVAGTLCFQLGEDRFRAYWLGSERLVFDKGDLSDNWIEISSSMEFLRGAPSYTYIRDPVRGLCHRLISYNISGRGRHLKRHTEGRKSGARLFGGHFIGRLAHHFGLVSDDGLRGLSVVARELPLIDMGELVAVVGSPGAAEDGLAVDEGVQADPAPIQAPQQPPPHLLLRVGLCLRDWGDLRRRCRVTTRCQDFTGTCGEIDDRSGEILHIDDYIIPETYQAEDWRGQHFYSPTAARPMIPLSLIS
ncbi:hypothetical protein Tco_0223311 [Tanacetum coccineum]